MACHIKQMKTKRQKLEIYKRNQEKNIKKRKFSTRNKWWNDKCWRILESKEKQTSLIWRFIFRGLGRILSLRMAGFLLANSVLYWTNNTLFIRMYYTGEINGLKIELRRPGSGKNWTIWKFRKTYSEFNFKIKYICFTFRLYRNKFCQGFGCFSKSNQIKHNSTYPLNVKKGWSVLNKFVSTSGVSVLVNRKHIVQT